MGLRSAFDAATAERYLSHLEPAWKVIQDDAGRLRIRRRYRTKNFMKGLDLFQRIAEVAEAEGHHPDLALESWNNATVSVWTHERGGLTENDFVLAAKIDALGKADLLSKKPPLDD
ncbi:MAG: transcriptional coactivator/pterin dehydratase [Monoraphidium minutum]|nr:MAG: transcriptional coactivator/pterin dehydratase [Monoraphidium minutum]